MCKKIKYSTKEYALQDLDKLTFTNKKVKPTRAYLCTNCLSWHLTSLPINERQIEMYYEKLLDLKAKVLQVKRVYVEKNIVLNEKNQKLSSENTKLKLKNEELNNKYESKNLRFLEKTQKLEDIKNFLKKHDIDIEKLIKNNK